jgi:hypothetical protein
VSRITSRAAPATIERSVFIAASLLITALQSFSASPRAHSDSSSWANPATVARAESSGPEEPEEELVQKVEFAPAGSPELDRDFVNAFRSAPPNVTRSIDAAVQLIGAELSGWWWNCGYCALIIRNGASLYVPGSSRIGSGFRLQNSPRGLAAASRPEVGYVDRINPGNKAHRFESITKVLLREGVGSFCRAWLAVGESDANGCTRQIPSNSGLSSGCTVSPSLLNASHAGHRPARRR